jgi:hypothetical protein
MKTPEEIAASMVRVGAHANCAWVECGDVRIPLLNGPADADRMRGVLRSLIEQARADGAAAEREAVAREPKR